MTEPSTRGASTPVAPDACTSCGDDDFLVPVHRVYLTPADWDTEERRRTSEEIEFWCGVCLVHYPHERLDH